MSTATRIYVVGHIETGAKRLVRASNAAQAARHVIRTSHCVTVATQGELVSLVTGGVSVESCGSDAEEL